MNDKERRDMPSPSVRPLNEKLYFNDNVKFKFLNEARDAIFLIDMDGTVLYLNEAACRLRCRNKEELPGAGYDRQRLRNTILPEWHLSELLDKKHIAMEKKALRKDGTTIYLDINACIVETDNGSSILAVARDITERKQREEHLLKSHKELETCIKERMEELARINEALEAEKAEKIKLKETLKKSIARLKKAERMKSDFISRVSHELRHPLTMISGYTDLLVASRLGPLTAEQAEALRVTDSHVERLQGHIEELLNLSVMESGQVSLDTGMIDIVSLVEKRVAFFQSAYNRKGLYLKLQIEGLIPQVSGDLRRLTPVMDNLLDNACKFTDRGGVTVHIKQQEGWVRLEIADTGIGVSEEDINHIFDRFYQAEPILTRIREGTGLGLPIARILVDIQGGRIWAESPGRGCGSSFIVLLPSISVD
ncbi:MAG: PAS domain-containing sensor histidine kinase [bacterium]|jgi:two-component system sensor histidine kinase/response regulator|nr:PAS domain-containing sensor histidine kinase [bacterium]MDD3804760.1 PAS domain-containing sensor histidine kinase [bacterium]MDD4152089.1 PAS domain-containing sensor histidine kinase [bacterium]MDD4558028.1 PAS domain-containing sensor histidine kinase [bacterium]